MCGYLPNYHPNYMYHSNLGIWDDSLYIIHQCIIIGCFWLHMKVWDGVRVHTWQKKTVTKVVISVTVCTE